MVNTHTMDSVQLKKCIMADPIAKRQFGDVCPADRVPQKIRRRPIFYIVNTDVSGLPGTHWVAFYFPRRGWPEFFDSAGYPPEHHHCRFKHVLLANGSHYLYSRRRVQDFRTLTCGQFCLYYALRRCRSMSMKTILRIFSTKNLRVNENKVFRFVRESFRI
jgi:hypothetical protein